MKILALEAENIKNLKVVQIKPDGSLVVIGGDNDQGKTCVLDSIEYALNGASSIPSQPIRQGQKKARVVLDLGDIEVTRTFTSSGTRLIVKNKDGAIFSSPQSMLDKLVGKLSFDPLEFSRMDSKKQAEILKSLVGLNFEKLDIEYRELYDQRTTINRQGKDLRSRLDSKIRHEKVPKKLISLQQLVKKHEDALKNNQDIDAEQRALQSEMNEYEKLAERLKELAQSIEKRKVKILDNKKIDSEAIRTKITEAEQINNKIRDNEEYDRTDKQLRELRNQAQSLNDRMAAITNQKTDALTNVQFPIKGLAVDDNGVTFNGIPLDQCSSSRQIEISVAIGLVMNPKLRVLLVREGSLLDEKNLEIIAKMAAKRDAQIWIERVSKGKECQVIIEDGSVMEK